MGPLKVQKSIWVSQRMMPRRSLFVKSKFHFLKVSSLSKDALQYWTILSNLGQWCVVSNNERHLENLFVDTGVNYTQYQENFMKF